MSSRATADRDYFKDLFERHHRALYAYAYKKTKSSFAAEEIAQNTFIRFWQHRTRTGSDLQDSPENLLFFIAKALLVDFYRKKEATVSIEEAFSSSEEITGNSLEQTYETLHFKYLVRSAASTLPGRQKQIFEMNYFQELKHEEIAAELNISRQTVKNLLTKAMRQVRKLTAQQFLSSFTGLL